jgi:hypothetical protein
MKKMISRFLEGMVFWVVIMTAILVVGILALYGVFSVLVLPIQVFCDAWAGKFSLVPQLGPHILFGSIITRVLIERILLDRTFYLSISNIKCVLSSHVEKKNLPELCLIIAGVGSTGPGQLCLLLYLIFKGQDILTKIRR